MRKRLLAVLSFCIAFSLCIPPGRIPEGRVKSVAPSVTGEVEEAPAKRLTCSTIKTAVDLGHCVWFDDGLDEDGVTVNTTVQYIKLSFKQTGSAVKYDGFEIYRGKTEQKMKRVATVPSSGKQKTKGACETYKDKDVSPFASYYYKVRFYKKNAQTTYYGDFTDVCRFTAKNSTGKYSVEVVTEQDRKRGEQIIYLLSDCGNYDFKIEKRLSSVFEASNVENSANFRNLQYSYEGDINWENITKSNPVIYGGGCVFLRLRKKKGKKFFLNQKIVIKGFYYMDQMNRSEPYPVVLQIDFRKNKPEAKMKLLPAV